MLSTLMTLTFAVPERILR